VTDGQTDGQNCYINIARQHRYARIDDRVNVLLAENLQKSYYVFRLLPFLYRTITTSVDPRRIAGCCHLPNLMGLSQAVYHEIFTQCTAFSAVNRYLDRSRQVQKAP